MFKHQLLQSEPLIPQMEVTFSAMKRSQELLLSRGDDSKNLPIIGIFTFTYQITHRLYIYLTQPVAKL